MLTLNNGLGLGLFNHVVPYTSMLQISGLCKDAKVQETSLEHVVILGLDVTVRIELYLVTVIVTWVLESRRLQNVVLFLVSG